MSKRGNRRKGKAAHGKQSLGEVRMSRSEPLHVLRSDEVVSAGPNVLRKIEVSLDTLPLLKHFAEVHQRYKLYNLHVSYHPSVGSLVNCEFAIFALADTDVAFIEGDDVFTYIDGGLPSTSFQVSRRGSFHVPPRLLLGTVNDGWFHSGTRPSDPGERTSCQLWIVQSSELTTSADADAVEALDVLGHFRVKWTAGFLYSAPLSASKYPLAAGLTRPEALSTDIVEGSVDLSSVEFNRETRTLYQHGSPYEGPSYIKTVIVKMRVSHLTAALHSDGAHSRYRDLATEMFGMPHDATDSPFTNGSTELWFGVDLVHLGGLWREYSINTAAYAKGSDHQRRDIAGAISWILNKIAGFANDEWNRESEHRSFSIWDVVANVGVLAFELLLARDTPSAYQTLCQSVANLLASRDDHSAQLAHEALTSAGARPLVWFVGIDPYAPMDNEGTAPSASMSHRRSSDNADRIRNHSVTIDKWVGHTPSGLGVFWPFEGEPDRQGGVSRRTRGLPVSDEPEYKDVTFTWTGTAGLTTDGGPGLCQLYTYTGGDATTVSTVNLLSSFPLVGPSGESLGTIDLSTGRFACDVRFEPTARTEWPSQGAIYQESSPTTGVVEWLESRVNAGTAQVFTEPRHFYCACDTSDPEVFGILASIVNGSASMAVKEDIYPGMPDSKYYGTVTIRCYELVGEPAPLSRAVRKEAGFLSRRRRAVAGSSRSAGNPVGTEMKLSENKLKKDNLSKPLRPVGR